MPSVQNPHLAISKTATEANYDAVGDVIHYTIVATNDGNVTLHNVTVTDPNVSNLSCTPATPVANLAPGASINCTATHTVTQADLDAGHYANTSCVDDGPAGAPQVCDSEDVPSVNAPHLSISKLATEANYDSVGDVINYTIVATNDGNVTLHNVTVTRSEREQPELYAGEPVANLAPGASISCTATHTVTQADIDAGHYANTSCVDDGPAGAPQACDSEDVPAAPEPASGDHEDWRRRRTTTRSGTSSTTRSWRPTTAT